MFNRAVPAVRYWLPNAALVIALLIPVTSPLASGQVVASEPPLPTLQELLPDLREGLRANAELFSGYRFRQRITNRDRDKDGTVKETTVREYDVRPNAWGAPAEWILVREDGKPVSQERIDKRRKALQQQWQGSDAKIARLRREAAENQRELEEAIAEVFRNLNARVVGRVERSGHSTLEIAFEPRPDARAKTRIGRVFRQIAGRVWIREQDRQLVRFEGEAVDTIRYGWGIIARIHGGTRLEFERQLVDDEVWLPASYHLKGSARTLLFRVTRFDRQSEFLGYERTGASNTATAAAR